jgi:small subunit ribosomal protein S1
LNVHQKRAAWSSPNAALAEPGRRPRLFSELRPGQTIAGTVTNTTDFGVFIDLGGVEGLIHISELSWGRVSHPREIVQIGQQLDVQVLELAPERSRVALSLKRLQSNPWTRSEAEFPAGSILPASISSILSYGAFARLAAGVEGLIHVSEMPLPPGATIRDWLVPGQAVTVRVLC